MQLIERKSTDKNSTNDSDMLGRLDEMSTEIKRDKKILWTV